MILTHESGSQEDQFDEKKWRQKISWYYPFKHLINWTDSWWRLAEIETYVGHKEIAKKASRGDGEIVREGILFKIRDLTLEGKDVFLIGKKNATWQAWPIGRYVGTPMPLIRVFIYFVGYFLWRHDVNFISVSSSITYI